jgi:secreted trypsin-like serine protease
MFPTGSAQADSIDVMIAPYIVDGSQTYTRIRSAKVIPHKLYGSNGMLYDLALIKLRTALPSQTKIALPSQGDNSLTGSGAQATVIGYGIWDTANLGSFPDTLQMVQIQIIDNATCNAKYGGTIMSSQVCAGTLTGKAKGAAAGDSGGPLFVNTVNGPVQVGIVSYGAGQYSTSQYPGVYTKVSAHRNWIDSVINADTNLVVSTVSQDKAIIARSCSSISVTLEEPAQNDLSYAIYNSEGRIVRNGTWTKGKSRYEAEAADLQYALYFIQITDKRNYNFTGKVPLLR